jgi:protein SCO1/2
LRWGTLVSVVISVVGSVEGCQSRDAGRGAGDSASLGAARNTQDAARPFAGVELPKAYERPDVWLTDTRGRRFNFRQETAGAVTLVEFGYTHCPDICPVTMANIAAALERQPYDVSSKVKVYFVTQDPERDTPAALGKWLDSFNPDFVGVIGPANAVDSLRRAFDIAPAVLAKSSVGDTAYSVGHASQVVVFTADNRAHLVYPFGTRQEQWTHDFPKLVALTQWTGNHQ